MNSQTISQSALDIIQNYSVLPFPNHHQISCPYFNNRRSKVRAGLRVLIGKGTSEEIIDEALLFALREKIDFKNISTEDLKKFLVDHNLGIDCSAFAYYVLAAVYYEKSRTKLSSKLFYPGVGSFRKLLIKLRPVENIGVRTLSHEKNSQSIGLKDVVPGDVVIILNSGKEHNLNHILLIYKVEYENNLPKNICYTHSFQWSVDGKYNHGIKFGCIEVTDVNKSLLEQKWIEADKTGEENETFLRASDAEIMELKRLNVFGK